ncbi:MAG: VPGUxxT family thioredoxin-like (seleno)protein, type 2 [Phycisphaerales bacterium]
MKLTCLAILLAASHAESAPASDQTTASPAAADAAHPELGRIDWRRDFDAAAAEAKEVRRPLLVLFDEVPGCHTCVSYGQDVLSHPLIVEAAETLFVPVAVFNNAAGDDRRILDSFGEPAWNNPVVRIVDHDRAAMAPRLADAYDAATLADTMIEALAEEAPRWLELLADDAPHPDARPQTATFGMHCFWQGEAELSGLAGVHRTTVGFLDGAEVVEVTFDANRLAYADLLREALRLECAHRVFTRDASQQSDAASIVGDRAVRTDEPIRRSRKDELYFLRRSRFAAVPMTWRQAATANHAINEGGDPATVLSPGQSRLFRDMTRIGEWPDLIGRDDACLIEDWRRVERRLNSESDDGRS